MYSSTCHPRGRVPFRCHNDDFEKLIAEQVSQIRKGTPPKEAPAESDRKEQEKN